MELARFDGNAVCEGSNGVCEGANAGIDVDSGGLLTAPVSAVQEKGGECVTEIVAENGVLDETEVRGGPVRTWKRLAREKVALDKDSPPLTVKRGIRDSLEGLEDMVPKKRRCANIKIKKRWRLESSPAEANELLSLELPWAWEPTCKKRA